MTALDNNGTQDELTNLVSKVVQADHKAPHQPMQHMPPQHGEDAQEPVLATVQAPVTISGNLLEVNMLGIPNSTPLGVRAPHPSRGEGGRISLTVHQSGPGKQRFVNIPFRSPWMIPSECTYAMPLATSLAVARMLDILGWETPCRQHWSKSPLVIHHECLLKTSVGHILTSLK